MFLQLIIKHSNLLNNRIAVTEHVSKGIINEARYLIHAITFAGIAQTMRAKKSLMYYAIREKATVSEVERALICYTNSVRV